MVVTAPVSLPLIKYHAPFNPWSRDLNNKDREWIHKASHTFQTFVK